MGDGGCQADSAHQENVLQQSDEDGDRLVRLHLCRGAQHSHVRVSGTMAVSARFIGVFRSIGGCVMSLLQWYQQDQRRHCGSGCHFFAALHHLCVRFLCWFCERMEVNTGHCRSKSTDWCWSRSYGSGEAWFLLTETDVVWLPLTSELSWLDVASCWNKLSRLSSFWLT